MALSDRLWWNIRGTATAGPQAIEGIVDPRGAVTADRGSFYLWNTATVRAWFVNDSATATGTTWRPLGSQLSYRASAPSAVITNLNVETLFDINLSIPASTLAIGSSIRVWGSGFVPGGTATADTLTLRVRVGGVAGVLIFQGPAIDVADNDEFVIDARATLRTVGAAGTIVGGGMSALGVPGTATARSWAVQSTAIDTTAALVVGVTAQWSAAAAANQVRLDQLEIDVE